MHFTSVRSDVFFWYYVCWQFKIKILKRSFFNTWYRLIWFDVWVLLGWRWTVFCGGRSLQLTGKGAKISNQNADYNLSCYIKEPDAGVSKLFCSLEKGLTCSKQQAYLQACVTSIRQQCFWNYSHSCCPHSSFTTELNDFLQCESVTGSANPTENQHPVNKTFQLPKLSAPPCTQTLTRWFCLLLVLHKMA